VNSSPAAPRRADQVGEPATGTPSNVNVHRLTASPIGVSRP